jgi:hypothetical protein
MRVLRYSKSCSVVRWRLSVTPGSWGAEGRSKSEEGILCSNAIVFHPKGRQEGGRGGTFSSFPIPSMACRRTIINCVFVGAAFDFCSSVIWNSNQ